MDCQKAFVFCHGPLTRKHKRILSYMDQLWIDGEDCCSHLAEIAADEFDLYEDHNEYNIPEYLYDLALIVAENNNALEF